MSNDKTTAPAEANVEIEVPAAEKITKIAAPLETKKHPKREKSTAAKGEKKDEKEEKVMDEKVMTINLRHAYLTYGRKAAPKAVRLVKKVTRKVFKTEDVKIANSLNEVLWSKGKTKTKRRVSVKVQKLESGTVRVLPTGE